VTALHNHFFFDEPKVYFTHIGGMGDANALAASVKKVYDKVAEIMCRLLCAAGLVVENSKAVPANPELAQPINCVILLS
jgi:Domain of Unknown Function (DUF1259)